MRKEFKIEWGYYNDEWQVVLRKGLMCGLKCRRHKGGKVINQVGT